MLRTRNRREYAYLSDDVIMLKPSASTQEYYNSINQPALGTPTPITNFTGSPVRLEEWLRDEESNNRTRWNDCEHYKAYFHPEDANGLYYSWFSPTSETPSRFWEGVGRAKYLLNLDFGYLEPSLGRPDWFVPREDGGFVPPPPGLDYLKQRSINAMTPGIKSDLSLLNSFIELKDFRSLPRSLDRAARLARDIPNILSNIVGSVTFFSSKVRNTFSKGYYGHTLREIFRSTADGYLQAQFNINPLLRDISSIYTALSRLEKQIRQLLLREGRPQRRHFVYRWTQKAIDPLVEVVWNDGYENGTFHTVGGEILYTGTADTWEKVSFTPDHTSTFHAEMEYSYRFTPLQKELAPIVGLLDMLGINFNPAIIWNAIPWTFVVDWVINVSQWLDSRKQLFMEPSVNISRYLWSWSSSRETRVRYYTLPSPRWAACSIRMPSVYETVYRRECKLPDKSSLVTSGLSPKEISLGVALAITRRRRPHNRGRYVPK